MHAQDLRTSPDKPAPAGRRGANSGFKPQSTAGLLALLLVGVIMFLPTNFIVRSPGPVLNTLGEVEGTRLLSIDGATTYASDSTLDMLTVLMQGGGQNRITAPIVLEALFDPTRDIAPEETVLPRGVSSSERSEQNDFQMISSQDQAIAAALTELGYDFDTWLDVAGFATDVNDGELVEGDRLLRFDGQKITSLEQLKEQLEANGDKPGVLTVRRQSEGKAAEEIDVKVLTTEGPEGNRQLGILLNTTHDFPLDVNFGVENIGGPSAGMMFALAIIDQLTEGSLAGEHHVAGTGTIDQQGNVGPIGGIAQKLVAAKRNGATIFLAPADNCAEVHGRIPAGLNVVKVATLDEARTALEKIADGADPATMQTCQ